MKKTAGHWKKGKGKFGIFQPLMGKWIAHSDSPRGQLTCTREFRFILHDNFLQLTASWGFSDKTYEEIAVFGIEEKQLHFWSFTSDGKKSSGHLAAAPEIHPDAICFEAQMPAGTARMIYWPDETSGFHWAVESKTKKGWNRFVTHHYLPA